MKFIEKKTKQLKLFKKKKAVCMYFFKIVLFMAEKKTKEYFKKKMKTFSSLFTLFQTDLVFARCE